VEELPAASDEPLLLEEPAVNTAVPAPPPEIPPAEQTPPPEQPANSL
jgi:hypothetical protein